MFFLSTLFNLKDKVDIFLIPCPIKYFLGLDCPGCGFQRAILALIEGDFLKSFRLYPPTVFLLISFLMVGFAYVFKWDKNSRILTGFLLLTGFVIYVNYVYKIINHQLF
jgi:hypothetical protein